MIHILHGEDIVSSRNHLNRLLEGAQNIVRIDGKKEAIGVISQTLSSDSLFSDKKTLTIEFFTKIKPQKDFIELISRFENNANIEVFLWEDAEIKAKSVLSAFKNVKIELFSFPKTYYSFLDSYSPAPIESFRLLQEVLKT